MLTHTARRETLHQGAALIDAAFEPGSWNLD
jgi:hypothetical protein